jgi:hypothetical protein
MSQDHDPLPWDPLPVPEVLERHGYRGFLHYQAAEDGVEAGEMIAWADTAKDELR